MNEKILSYLGICRRAGRLTLGFDACVDAVERKKSRLVLLSNDISPRTQRNIVREAEKNRVRVLVLDFGMEQIGMAVGKKTGVISVNDDGFAKKLTELAE